ncbi:MAG: hypothetical protein IIA62_08840, partial [Nitrospinae bacterium]|nr:hypothetical protein [Nitrospinota bacterium]
MFLTFLTFLPLAGAIGLAFIPKENVEAIKQTALAIALADFLLSLQLWVDFDLTTADMQFEFMVPWIETWGISYHVGIDGISLLLYIMTTFLTAISILASWNIKKYIKEYMFAMLALSTGMLGVFISLDMFLFYVFWEFQLVPMYLIIGIWGGPRRIYAAIKFFIYTAVGSLLMLVAIIWSRRKTPIDARIEGLSSSGVSAHKSTGGNMFVADSGSRWSRLVLPSNEEGRKRLGDRLVQAGLYKNNS